MTCTPPRDVYFGAPGALVAIEWPRGGIVRTRGRQVSEFVLDGGGVRVGRQPGGKIRYTLSWEALTWADFAQVWAYEQGHNGPGPWVLLDPRAVNLLTVNQSAATSETNDTTGFTVAGTGGIIASSTTLVRRGPRSLAWSFATTTPGASTLTLDTPDPVWTGVPAHVGDTYTFAAQVRGGGTDAIMDVTAQILWYTAAGAAISTSSGAAVTSGAGAWGQPAVTATAPATTAFALCRLSVASATITAGGILYVDEPQLEVAAAASTWVPGVGIQPVEIVSLSPEQHQYTPGTVRVGNPVLILQEVGP